MLFLDGSKEPYRIFDPPLCLHRLTGPNRARFVSGFVADCENEIKARCTVGDEFIPMFTAQTGCIVIEALQQLDGQRIDLTDGVTAGTKSSKPSVTHLIQYGFSHDAASRIPGTDEQNVVGFLSHFSVQD